MMRTKMEEELGDAFVRWNRIEKRQKEMARKETKSGMNKIDR